MSNATWACFDCRQVVRRPTYPRKTVPCPLCRRSCFCLGRKIPVPPKGKIAARAKLRSEMQQLVIAWQVRGDKAAVARRHEVEKRIRELELRPTDASCARRLKKLREALGGR